MNLKKIEFKYPKEIDEVYQLVSESLLFDIDKRIEKAKEKELVLSGVSDKKEAVKVVDELDYVFSNENRYDMNIERLEKERNEKIEQNKLNEIVIIAGGCLSDSYMGKEIKDIDVFVTTPITKEAFEKFFGKSYEIIVNADYNDIEVPLLYKTMYKGYEVEVIISNHSKISEFDLRFRQFYYLSDGIYASEKALEDIENKKLIVSNPSTPITTYFRLKKFEEKYGFKIDEKSYKYLAWSMNLKTDKTLNYKLEEYLEKKKHTISNSLYEKLKKEQEEKNDNGYFYLEKEMEFPYNKIMEKMIKDSIVLKAPIEFSIYHEDLENFKEIELNFEKLENLLEAKKENLFELDKIYKRYRIQYLLSGKNKITPFPNVNLNKNLKDIYKYKNERFIENLMEIQNSEIVSRESSIKPEDEKLIYATILDNIEKFEIVYGQYHTDYANVVSGNQFILNVKLINEIELKYVMNKNEDGKYMLIEFENNNELKMYSSIFYFKEIMNHIEKNNEEKIYFGTEIKKINLNFSYSPFKEYSRVVSDYSHRNSPNFFVKKKKEYQGEIRFYTK